MSSGEEKVRAGPEEAGRRGVGRKPGTTGRVQHDPPGRGGGGKGDDGCWWTGRRGQRGERGRPEATSSWRAGRQGRLELMARCSPSALSGRREGG